MRLIESEGFKRLYECPASPIAALFAALHGGRRMPGILGVFLTSKQAVRVIRAITEDSVDGV